MELIREIRLIYDNYDFQTEILAASMRNPIHVNDAAMLGADVMTVPPACEGTGQAPADRQRPGLPRRLGEDRPEDRLRSAPLP